MDEKQIDKIRAQKRHQYKQPVTLKSISSSTSSAWNSVKKSIESLVSHKDNSSLSTAKCANAKFKSDHHSLPIPPKKDYEQPPPIPPRKTYDRPLQVPPHKNSNTDSKNLIDL